MRSWCQLIKRICYLCFIGVLGSTTCHSQVYHLSKEVDYSIAFGVLSATAFDFGLRADHRALSTTEALALDPQSIPGFERDVIFNSSLSAAEWSDYLQYGAIALPLSILIPKKEKDDLLTVSVMLLEGFSLNLTATFLTKNLSRRPRPFAYNPETTLTDIRIRATTESFVSGHTSNSAMFGVFTATVFSTLFPESKWKTPVWIASLSIPAAVGVMRVNAGRHFPTDAIAGYALGAFIGYIVPELHRKNGRVQLSVFSPGTLGLRVGLN